MKAEAISFSASRRGVIDTVGDNYAIQEQNDDEHDQKGKKRKKVIKNGFHCCECSQCHGFKWGSYYHKVSGVNSNS